MKYAALLCVLLVSGRAWGTEYWQDDNDGNGYQCVDVSKLSVGTAVPDTQIQVYANNHADKHNGIVVQNVDSTGISAIRLYNDAGDDLYEYQGAGMSIAGTGTNSFPGTANALVIHASPAGTNKAIELWQALGRFGRAQLGPYQEPDSFAVSGFWTEPLDKTQTNGYAFVGAVNDVGNIGELTMTSSVVTSPPFSISDAVYIWNQAHGPICLMTDGASNVNGTCAFELDGSQNITATSMAGSGTRCVQVDSTGKFSPAAGACGTGTGTVTAVTATPPIISSGGTTPNITEQGAIVSGSTSTTAQNLGSIATSILACATSGGVCTVDGVTVSGGLAFNTSTATETLGSFTCSAHQFVSSSSTSGLACTQPTTSDIVGPTGGGTQCLQVSNTGAITGTGTACGTGSGGITALTHDVTASGSGSVSATVTGLTDGTGGDHVITGAWGANSLLTTDGLGNVTAETALVCSQIPAAGTCTPTTTVGSTGAYLTSVQTDTKGWVTGVTTTSVPLAGALVYTINNVIFSMGYNQSTLVMPLPAGVPIVNAAAAGVAVSSTLAANWGSSSQSPPTFALASLGSVKCTGDITNYSISGPSAVTMVTALYYVTTNPFTPANWHLIASGSSTFGPGSGNFFNGISFSTSSTSGLIPASSSVLLVMYRSDAGSTTTLSSANLQIACQLGA